MPVASAGSVFVVRTERNPPQVRNFVKPLLPSTADAGSTGSTDYARPPRKLRGLLGNQQFILLIVYLLMVAFFTSRSRIFFSTGVYGNIFNDFGPLVLIAVGQMFVMVSGGIDLSVGYNIALSNVVAALAMRNLTLHYAGDPGTPDWHPNVVLFIGLLVAVGTGMAVGLVNAFLINKAKLVPFIATLVSLGACKGLSTVLTHNGPIGEGPTKAISLSVPYIGPFSRPLMAVIVFIIILGLVLHLTKFGRHTFAIGSNEFAARGAGINIARHVTKVYVLSGFCAGLASFFFLLRLASGFSTTGAGNELDAIAAVVIGGTALTGGVGRISGTILGALMITSVYSGLTIINVKPEWKAFIVALMIAIAATAQALRKTEGKKV
jgi:ribose transport system permease protein